MRVRKIHSLRAMLVFVSGWFGLAVPAAQLPSRGARPGRVEPTYRQTFGPGRETPPGTVFYIKVLTRGPNASIRLQLCGVDCATAVNVKIWEPAAYAAGDELSWRVGEAGEYYLWSENVGSEAVSGIVSDTVVDGRLRMTFDNGAVLEAWYVPPRVPPKRKPTTR